MSNLLVPEEFEVPNILETDKIHLRMLTINDVVKDYDAVMTSINHLQTTQPFGQFSEWPTKELTFEQDLIDLGWHQKEFKRRTSFAYTVMNKDESECIGCMYIYPSPNSSHDATIIMRARESRKELDQHLFDSVNNWIKEKWPFENPGYPGRSIDWQSWYELK